MDKSKKKEAKKEEDGSTVTNKDDLHTVPVKKDKMTDEGCECVVQRRVKTTMMWAELKNESKADSEPGQQIEGEEEKSSNADMI